MFGPVKQCLKPNNNGKRAGTLFEAPEGGSTAPLCGKAPPRPNEAFLRESFAEVQGMPLIVVDDKLAGVPGGLVDVRHQGNAVLLQGFGGGDGVVGLEVEVEVAALLHEV